MVPTNENGYFDRPADTFCVTKEGDDGKWYLTIEISNIGDKSTGDFTSTIFFITDQGHNAVDFQIASLDASYFHREDVVLPFDCFNPDCHFLIEADSSESIDEQDENNNVASGICTGAGVLP